jgi:hypothetical protein
LARCSASRNWPGARRRTGRQADLGTQRYPRPPERAGGAA